MPAGGGSLSDGEGALIPQAALLLAEQPYRFDGKELYSSTGTYDFLARQYDPALCRFTTPDPLASKYPSISPYAYCANDPVNRFDPDGLADYPYRIKEYYHKYIVTATVYTNQQSYSSAKQARDFWNNRTEDSYNGKVIKYQITVLPIGNGELAIKQGEGGYKANPDVNKYEVNDKKVDEHNAKNQNNGKGDSIGFHDPNTGNMYVHSAYAENLPNSNKQSTTGAHEFGHMLGMEHSATGIMTTSQNKYRSNAVTANNIQQMMANTKAQKSFWVNMMDLFNRYAK